MATSSALQTRARQVRARAAVRSWKYRQRHHAKGTWFRLRRLLAGTRACWRITGEEAQQLVAEGYAPEAAGKELHPPKTILVLPADRIAAIPGRRPLRVALTAELLAAEHLVLVPFG